MGAKTNAQRQQEFKDRNAELGRFKRSVWCTDKEYEALMKLLKTLRG